MVLKGKLVDVRFTQEMIDDIIIGKEMLNMSNLEERDITTELYREYDFGGRVYRIDNPKSLYYRNNGTTHRILDLKDVVHCVPAPGVNGCVLRWQNKDTTKPCEF